MSRSRSAAEFDDAALDRVLSCASVPEVPSGLAERIAATVTALPQEKEPVRAASVVLPPKPARRSRMLAASLAASVALVGETVARWFGSSAGRSGVSGKAPAKTISSD